MGHYSIVHTVNMLVPEGKCPKTILVDEQKGPFIPYSRIGKEGTKMDALRILNEMTSAERNLILEMRDLRNHETNEVDLPQLNNTTHSVKRSTTLGLLRKRDVIKKIGQRKFIINPYFLIPEYQHKEQVKNHWENLP